MGNLFPAEPGNDCEHSECPEPASVKARIVEATRYGARTSGRFLFGCGYHADWVLRVADAGMGEASKVKGKR